ncbi:MAG: hypothetical protein ABW069_18920 [Duganella sp.]
MVTIAQLDLDPIKVKLMHKESGEGWSLERVNAVEFEYRRFLILMKKYPHEATSPLVDVDTFWHYHILDTMKYAADCDAVFGYFLHHFPYIGMRGEEDAAVLAQIGRRMQELYEEEFGEPYLRGSLAAGSADPAYCGWTPNQSAPASAKSAYCGWTPNQSAAPGAQSAYCGWIPDQSAAPVAQSAYCGWTPQQAAAQAAYCGWTPSQYASPGASGGMIAGARNIAAMPGLYTERPRLS